MSNLFLFNIYLFGGAERECKQRRGRASERERERERERESEVGSRLRAVSTESDTGLKLRSHEIMT